MRSIREISGAVVSVVEPQEPSDARMQLKVFAGPKANLTRASKLVQELMCEVLEAHDAWLARQKKPRPVEYVRPVINRYDHKELEHVLRKSVYGEGNRGNSTPSTGNESQMQDAWERDPHYTHDAWDDRSDDEIVEMSTVSVADRKKDVAPSDLVLPRGDETMDMSTVPAPVADRKEDDTPNELNNNAHEDSATAAVEEEFVTTRVLVFQLTHKLQSAFSLLEHVEGADQENLLWITERTGARTSFICNRAVLPYLRIECVPEQEDRVRRLANSLLSQVAADYQRFTSGISLSA